MEHLAFSPHHELCRRIFGGYRPQKAVFLIADRKGPQSKVIGVLFLMIKKLCFFNKGIDKPWRGCYNKSYLAKSGEVNGKEESQ